MLHTSSQSPIVSVVIPTYNRSSTLYYALSSVLNQTFQDFEIFVVDDASTDVTPQLMEQFSDPRIGLIDFGIAIKKDIKVSNAVSPKNFLIRSNLSTPNIFLIPTSLLLLIAFAVDNSPIHDFESKYSDADDIVSRLKANEPDGTEDERQLKSDFENYFGVKVDKKGETHL